MWWDDDENEPWFYEAFVWTSSGELIAQVLQRVRDDLRVYLLVAATQQHGDRDIHAPAHPHDLLISGQDRLPRHRELPQRVAPKDVGAGIKDNELWVVEVEVHFDGLDKAEVFLVGGGPLDLDGLSDGVPALGVLGENLTIITIHDVDSLVYDQILLVAIPLVRIQVYYHYLPYLLTGL